MHTRSRFVLAFLAILCLGAATASADWYDGFESYPAGGGVDGMGGWAGWNGDSAADAIVTDLLAFAGSQSLAVAGACDIVQAFSGYTAGVWHLSAWMYIPTDYSGETYFIVLNTYEPNGTQNWSTQIHFVDGSIIVDIGGGTASYITGEWVEVMLVIDLESDLQSFYYDGTLVSQWSWTEGMSGGGALNIGCIDLYANGATPVYYDEMRLEPATVAVEQKSFSQVKSLFR